MEEQLHRVATTWTAQMLKEPLQRVVLDIALGAWAVKSSIQTLNTQDLIQDLKGRTQSSLLLVGSGYIVWLPR